MLPGIINDRKQTADILVWSKMQLFVARIGGIDKGIIVSCNQTNYEDTVNISSVSVCHECLISNAD